MGDIVSICKVRNVCLFVCLCLICILKLEIYEGAQFVIVGPMLEWLNHNERHFL